MLQIKLLYFFFMCVLGLNSEPPFAFEKKKKKRILTPHMYFVFLNSIPFLFVCLFFATGSYFVAQAGLNLMILLAQPPKC
jgi:hypothetical protein